MINFHPTKCNLCGGKVIFASNSIIYGREYGSGKCYYCTNCKAHVGTHKPRPKEALGILADKEMREWKQKCHRLFDAMWKTHRQRNKCYEWLAGQMNIKVSDCHFGYFDLDQLKQAYEILLKERED